MGDEQIFDLLRIDIHAARDNHEALSIGQIQIAVGVDMPDIAERAPLRMVRMTRIACLFGVVEILEIPSALEIDEAVDARRSEEHTSELQSLMRISYAVFCLKKKTQNIHQRTGKHNTKN